LCVRSQSLGYCICSLFCSLYVIVWLFVLHTSRFAEMAVRSTVRRDCPPGRIRRVLRMISKRYTTHMLCSLEEIDEQTSDYAHRLSKSSLAEAPSCLTFSSTSSRSFSHSILYQYPHLANWCPADPVYTLISICSCLLAVFKPGGRSPVAHLSVKDNVNRWPRIYTKRGRSSGKVSLLWIGSHRGSGRYLYPA
jgi:hypothetical protein